MENVVKRLKQEQDAGYQAGKNGAFEMGASWAKNDASLGDLRALCEKQDDEFEEWIGCNEETTSGEALYNKLLHDYQYTQLVDTIERDT